MRALPFLLVSLLLAGCLGEAVEPVAHHEDLVTEDAESRIVTASYGGTATALPAEPEVHEFLFEVPTGAVGVNATLAWDAPAARFKLALIDPYGETRANGYPERAGRLVATTLDPPPSGTWTLRVTAEAAVQLAFTLDAAAELIVPQDNLVRQTTELRARGWNEVNVIMEEGATFHFHFTASDEIEWDVHSHPDNRVKYWQQGMDDHAEGSFTAPERGIYSLLFHNPHALPVELSFEMSGAFRLHSHAQ